MGDKYIVQEIQTDINGNVTLLPAIVKSTRNEGESEYHIKLGYAAISDIAVHSVIMYNQDGTPILHGCYSHLPKTEEDGDEPEVTE